MIPARGAELLGLLAALPPRERDRAAEEWLGIGGDPPPTAAPGPDLVGHHPSGVSPIVRALRDAPVAEMDVVVDLGSGLGKVVMLAHLLTGARARGVELQPELVARAQAAAASRSFDVGFSQGDVRTADLRDGTVFFLYTPCTGPALAQLLARLRTAAERRAIVVCALGCDLHRDATWLVPRPTDAFWLTVYDGVLPGVPPRPALPPLLAGPDVEALVSERARGG